MPVADVLLVRNASTLARDELAEREPPLTRAFEIAPGIQLSGVKKEVARQVLYACEFRHPEPDGDTITYGFVRYDPPGRRWDEDQQISKALYLSHVAHAHEAGFELSARIETDDRGRLVRLEPAKVLPWYARAYCCAGVTRRWLTQADAEELRDLIVAYDAAREYLRHKRIGMAVSLFADSCFVYHGRSRVSLLAAILEGLVCISPERALKQFTVRIPALAAEVRLPQFNRNWADRMYKLRSKLVHGVPLFQSPQHEQRQLAIDEVNTAMTDMDELVRQLIKRALLDRGFADRVHDVATHWPVAGKGCARCRGRVPTLSEIQCPRCGSKWT